MVVMSVSASCAPARRLTEIGCARLRRCVSSTCGTPRQWSTMRSRPCVDQTYAQAIRRTAAKAQRRDSLQALSKLTRLVDGRRRLASDPPLLIPIDELVGEAEARVHEEHMGALI